MFSAKLVKRVDITTPPTKIAPQMVPITSAPDMSITKGNPSARATTIAQKSPIATSAATRPIHRLSTKNGFFIKLLDNKDHGYSPVVFLGPIAYKHG